MAAVGFENTDYFLCPDRSIWCKGLDAGQSVPKILKVFDTLEDAINRAILSWGGYKETLYISAYRLESNEDGMCANEVLRLAASPERKIFGPMVYVDRSVDDQLPPWCVPDAVWDIE